MTDRLDIPQDWNDARPYLEHALEERRTRLDRRDDILEEKIDSLDRRFGDTQMELHAVRSEVGDVRIGMSHLNESFRNVSEKYALALNVNGQIYKDLRDDQAIYLAKQDEIAKDVRRTTKILIREDALRNVFRVAILIGVYTLIFAILIGKVTL